jgi:lipopolysaccharide export system protein LptC
VSARQFGLYALLALLVVATGWYLFTRETGLQPPTASASGADAFVEDMDMKVLNEAGQLEYRVIARYMMHYPGDERFTLEQPDIRLHQSNGDTWHIVSDRGETNEEADTIWLLGDVDIKRRGSATSKPLHIITSDLLVLPEEEVAETDNATTIISEELEVHGIGARADFKNDTLELRSSVRGRYDKAS